MFYLDEGMKRAGEKRGGLMQKSGDESVHLISGELPPSCAGEEGKRGAGKGKKGGGGRKGRDEVVVEKSN